ncbi:MAG: GldG family protein [Proteobacteria bacterium]|nr:GldG family protein [Pseudomonadota bacterium]
MFITDKTRLQSRLNSIVMICLLTIVVGLLAWLSNKHVIEYDWTSSGRHTLSEASRDLLAKMPDPIEITSYARENQLLRDAIKKFISKYQRHKSDIVLRFVNPDAVPDEVRNLGISVDGEIIVRYQNRTEHVKSDSEQIFTNALQRLARNQERWIAFVEGHGERSILGKANHDLGEWGKQLLNQGFHAQPINLSETQAIPDNTNLLIIAGPRIDYLPGELEVILNYINTGGNLLWLHEPGPLYKLDALAEELAIRFYDGAVIDYAGQLIGINDPSIALVTSSLYAPHAITDGFEFTTLYPLAGAIELLQTDTWNARPIMTTGDHTWVETSVLEGAVEFNQEVDIKGPLTIGLSLERELEKPQGQELVTVQQRIIVLSDGDFLSNTYLANSGNNELGTRIINWLSSDDEFISIPPKVASDTQLNMSTTVLGIIGICLLFILPAALIVIGITIGIRRKKK